MKTHEMKRADTKPPSTLQVLEDIRGKIWLVDGRGPYPGLSLARRIVDDAIEIERWRVNAQCAPMLPTVEMLNAAREWSREKYGKPIGNDAATGCWQAMMGAALSSTERAADGNSYRYHATGLPAGGHKPPEPSHGE